MCLQSNERQRRTNQVAEPEPEGHGDLHGSEGYIEPWGIHIPVSHHFIIAVTLCSRRRELSPDVEPLSGMFINLHLSDFDTYILNECVTDVVDPVIDGTGTGIHQRWKIDLKKERPQEVGLAGNQTTDATTEIGVAVELNGDGLHREGRIATKYVLEKRHLGVTREIDILTTTGHEL